MKAKPKPGICRECLSSALLVGAGEEPLIYVSKLGWMKSSYAFSGVHDRIPLTARQKWDLPETSAKPGPYQEIVKSDVFVNCIYLSAKIPPFIDHSSLASSERKLTVVCDVSCDTTNPHNPIPIYNINTTFTNPTVPVKLPSGPDALPLSVISIDHLPSLLPRESSEAVSTALLPSLLQLHDWKNVRVWQQAEKLFKDKCATLPDGAIDHKAELVANQS